MNTPGKKFRARLPAELDHIFHLLLVGDVGLAQ